jgi:hypothetical protein
MIHMIIVTGGKMHYVGQNRNCTFETDVIFRIILYLPLDLFYRFYKMILLQ